MPTAEIPIAATPPASPPRRLVPRHSLLVRVAHWINVLCFSVLLMSGAQIFNAHPRLYWGQYGADNDHAFLAIDSLHDREGWHGALHLGPLTLRTTGLLGASTENDRLAPRGLPAWLTIPSYQDLATGRRWHFFFAWLFAINGAVYLVGGVVKRHFSRDLLPSRQELAPAHLLREVVDHAMLSFPKGEAARRYNVLQKLSYLGVAFALLPLMVSLRDRARHDGRRAMSTTSTRFHLRRRWLKAFAAGAGSLALAGCDRATHDPRIDAVLRSAEKLTLGSQRLILDHQPLAREYGERDLSPIFRSNGSTMPSDPAYKALLQGRFVDYRLRVDGLVRRPLALSLAQLKAMQTRTQITRHDCVEGWSAIGKWQGVPLSQVLDLAGLAPGARYVIFHCADDLAQSTDGSGLYYESIDLLDAYHPQTILAHGMNGRDLPVAHGAPLRLRVERQLGYKQAKYVMRIEVADAYSRLGGGRGGFWEDRGYEWYAGI